MARKDINIGIEGNDGTGDSIRDSFGKVNENFRELYAVLGQEGALAFTGLDDTPNVINTTDENKILVVDAENERIVFKTIEGDDTIVVNQTVPGVIKLSSLASAVVNDANPTLAANLNSNFKRITNLSEATEPTDATTKAYVDTKLSIAGVDAIDPANGSQNPNFGIMTGPLVLARNPIDSDDANWGGLVAATKAYVDSKTFVSAYNLYVATNGLDFRTDIPQNQIGRSEATAFKTVQRACEVAEDIINSAPFELGPYQKTLTYSNGTEICTLFSLSQSPLSGTGATAVARMGIDLNTPVNIVNGGTGYELGDELTLTAPSIVPARLRVIARDFAGSITQLQIITESGVTYNGIYSILPEDIDNVSLTGGSGSGGVRVSIRWQVTQIIVNDEGEEYGSASVIFNGGGGTGAEARVTEIGGKIKEITILNAGRGFTSIPLLEIYLPRLLLETDNKGTDFEQDIREGMFLRGSTSGALCRIVEHNAARNEDGQEIFEVELISGVFLANEPIEYGDPVRNTHVTIQVETGIYYENYPLRLSNNVAMKGDEYRRTIIRPKPGVSQSPWARVFFRRDQVIDGLRVTPYEYGYQYLTDPLDFSSTPKNNDEMDVLLCGDATRVSELTFQGHGGFVMVLDPDSQILSKSPYFQTGSSFSASNNEKRFAGGQFVDGFSGDLEAVLLERKTVGGVEDPSKLIIGGVLREPQLPTSFILNDDIFRITITNRIETNFFDAKVLLEQNRLFIQTETILWINSVFPTLDFNEDKCFRDVGLLVDAVVADTLFGGFLNSTQAGRLYFSAGSTVISGQVVETVAAVNKIKEISDFVIRQNIYPRVGQVTQITNINLSQGSLASATVEKCFNLIANIIEYGEKIYAAKSLLQDNKELIQSETINYIDVFYPSLDYDRSFCKRDVGYIVDAISIDIFGDFNNSLRAGHSYYRRGNRVFDSDQTAPTIDSINYAKSLMLNVVKGIGISPVRNRKTFNPATSINLVSNSITIPSHNFTSGSKVEYKNGGGTSIAINGDTDPIADGSIFFIYVIDGNTIQLYETFELVLAREKEVQTSIEVNIDSIGTGTTHTLELYQTIDLSVTEEQLDDAGVLDAIDLGVEYITTLIEGDFDAVPLIYPLYECLLDTPFYGSGQFNETDFSRDLDLALKSTAFDMVLDSNFQAIKTGRSYLRSFTSVNLLEQRTRTINGITKVEEEALALISGGTFSAARAALSDKFDIIRTMVRDGVSAAPTLTYTLPTGMSGTDNKAKARDILIANRAFIQAEVIAWINSENPTFDYDEVARSADLGYLIDSMTYDVLYGGNSQTKEHAESYYRDDESLIPGEETVYAAALGRLKTVIGFVVVNNVSWPKSPGNVLIQNTGLPTASAAEATVLGTLSDIVIDYVADGAFDTPVTVVNPTITGQNAALQTARATVIAESVNIQATVIDFLNNGRGKIVLGTGGNKSMLGNDFTQVNDMGYGVFATNNGLVESVSMFSYYCYASFFALNGAQIRSLNGSSSHGVYGLRSEGADPIEIPDSVTLKFPLIQTAVAYENEALDLVNEEGSLVVYVTNYSYTPRGGSQIEIDHTNDLGAGPRLGTRVYTVNAASTTDLPAGVCELRLTVIAGQEGLANSLPVGKPVIIRQNEEIVLSGKEDIVATRPSTALVFDEDRTNTIRVISFDDYTGDDALLDDVSVGTRDGFNYILLAVQKTLLEVPVEPGFGRVGDDQLIIQTLGFSDQERMLFETTGAMIFDGSTIGTGGPIFGYQDSMYEVTNYERVAISSVSSYGVVTFRNVSFPLVETRTENIAAITGTTVAIVETVDDHKLRDSRQVKILGSIYYVKVVDADQIEIYADADLTAAIVPGTITGATELIVLGGLTFSPLISNGNVTLSAGLRQGATGDVTVRISTMRATGHDFLDIGTGSFADTNYPNNIYGPPVNSPNAERQVLESNKGRVFFVSTDQSGNFKVGDFFAVDQGTGRLSLDAKIDLRGIDSLRLRTGQEIFEFSDDTTMGGIGPPDQNAVPTENAVRNYIDSRLGLTHDGEATTNLRGPGFLALNGELAMKGNIDMDRFTVRNLPDPRRGASGDNDAVRKSYMRMANLEDGPTAWHPEVGATVFGIANSDIVVFTGTNAEFTNGTVVGALTLARSGLVKNGLQANLTSGGTTVTLTAGNTTGIVAGQLFEVTAGSGRFGTGATVLAVTSSSEFTVTVPHSVTGAATFVVNGVKVVSSINSNIITDDNVNYDAAISQHKLRLNTVRATTADGIVVSGYVSSGASTVIVANSHGLNDGDTVVISGETTVTAINGDWRISSVTGNTFSIPANTTSGGVLSGSGRVRAFGLLSAVKASEFTVTNGFLALKDATSVNDGITTTKLTWIDPSVYNSTDNPSLSGTSTKVLGRRGIPSVGTPIGAVVPLDARTIVEDGDGLSRAEVPSLGLVRRIATGTGTNKFSTIDFSSSNVFSPSEGSIVQRNTTTGGFTAGDINVGNIVSTGRITLAGGVAADAGISITTNATTASVLTRSLNTGTSYYTELRSGSGASGIRVYDGDNTDFRFNNYYADEHRFLTRGGSSGTIQVSGGSIASGTLSAPTSATLVGNWSIAAGSTFAATWADLAEYYSSDKDYDEGTVVEFGGDAEVRATTEQATTRVAGVVSVKPGFIMNEGQQGTRALIALQGRVPCKIVGKVKKGDLIVASSIPGVAISAGTKALPGTIIGKALQDYDSDHIGKIEVAVGRL
jgi:hypothetical protein